MPINLDQLGALVQQPEILIFWLGATLVGLGLYSAYEFGKHEEYLNSHPEERKRFDAWRRLQFNANVCPQHGMYVPRGRSCPVCDWKPTRKP